MARPLRLSILAFALAASTTSTLHAQEARARWERMCQIRAEKFDLVMPTAMHDNGIHAGLFQQNDVTCKSLCQCRIAHGVTAKFDNDRGAVIALHVGQGL